MKKAVKIVTALMILVLTVGILALPFKAYAAGEDEEESAYEVVEAGDMNYRLSTTSMKALAAAIAIAIPAAIAAIAMGIATSKSVEGISRQPEASGKIQGLWMLGMVFIETVAIYALVVTILIVFVL
jgi:F-type H+-transporting ATPase subunit c